MSGSNNTVSIVCLCTDVDSNGTRRRLPVGESACVYKNRISFIHQLNCYFSSILFGLLSIEEFVMCLSTGNIHILISICVYVCVLCVCVVCVCCVLCVCCLYCVCCVCVVSVLCVCLLCVCVLCYVCIVCVFVVCVLSVCVVFCVCVMLCVCVCVCCVCVCCVCVVKYKGKTYASCTTKNSKFPWCSLTSNYDKDRKWEKCKGEKSFYSISTLELLQ